MIGWGDNAYSQVGGGTYEDKKKEPVEVLERDSPFARVEASLGAMSSYAYN